MGDVEEPSFFSSSLLLPQRPYFRHRYSCGSCVDGVPVGVVESVLLSLLLARQTAAAGLFLLQKSLLYRCVVLRRSRSCCFCWR